LARPPPERETGTREEGGNDNMMIDNKRLRIVAIGTVLIAMAAVSGCREEEQNRPLAYEKGTYLGKPDQKLTDAQRQELRARARNQAY